MVDTGICTVEDPKVYEVSSDDRSVICRVLKLKEQRPDEVQIIRRPEENWGSILARVPKNWVRIAPPPKSSMTDERKEALRKRMLALNASRGLEK